MYNGTEATVTYNTDQFTDYIDQSIGALHGDTLDSFLFAIVLDYVMKET
jgi:hypothetical protein